MITGTLNQTATWKRVTARNEYGDPTPVNKTINVRWEGKRRNVRDIQGRDVVSEARVYCLEAVQPGDLLTFGGRDWPVISVLEIPDLSGVVRFREVAL